MIPQDFIQTLLGRVDIVDVIDRQVPLRKAGANFVARCPFHNEKSPSFTVSPTKQFYHCFGCGANGTALGFLMQYSGMGFIEAVKTLADSVGMKVPEPEHGTARRAVQPSADLPAVLRAAMDYYREQLKRSDAAIAYLKQRGVSGTVAARYGLGYAPGGWQNLAAVFPDYAAPGLLEAGLVIDGDNGRRYDRFRDRVMFPVLDSRGEVIGFGGRVIGPGEPKYLNSPATPVFEKGRELYGLPQARRAIRERGRVLVVEGYMDVVALAQFEVGYAVATLGTATTEIHAQKLLRLADEIVFCFDGDGAGRKAARKALDNVLPFLADGRKVGFLFLPEGDDPDSFIRRDGAAVFEERVARALPLSAYLLEEIMAQGDLESDEGRAQILTAGKEMIGRVTAPALAMLLRKRLAERVRVESAEVDAVLGHPVAVRREAPAQGAVRRAGPSLERKLTVCLLFQPQLAQRYEPPPVPAGDRALAPFGALHEFLRGSPQVQHLGLILEHFQGGPYEGALRDASAGTLELLGDFSAEEVEQEYRDGLAQLAQRLRRRTLDALLAKAEREGLTPDEKRTYQTLIAERA